MQIVYDALPYMLSLATGFVGVLIGNRKRKADAAHAELENVQSAIRIWREIAQGLELKVDELMKELQLARIENKDLKLQVEKLERKLSEIDNRQ